MSVCVCIFLHIHTRYVSYYVVCAQRYIPIQTCRIPDDLQIIFGFAVEFVSLIELKNLFNVSSKFLCCGSNMIQFVSGLIGSGGNLAAQPIKDCKIFMKDH
jgi:hypothetical protein